jgi:hypothetical protein
MQSTEFPESTPITMRTAVLLGNEEFFAAARVLPPLIEAAMTIRLRRRLFHTGRYEQTYHYSGIGGLGSRRQCVASRGWSTDFGKLVAVVSSGALL